MKKLMTWLFAVSIFVFIIDWSMVGIKLLDGDYDILAEAYVALACCLEMVVFIIYKIITNRCPHCGRIIHQVQARFCPHCGKEIQ